MTEFKIVDIVLPEKKVKKQLKIVRNNQKMK